MNKRDFDLNNELSKDKYFEMPEKNKKVEKLKKKYEGLGNKIRLEDYKNKFNENNFIKENNLKAVSNNSYIFFKIMTILFFVFVVGITGFLIYIGYGGGFDKLISPMFNNTVNINNTFNNQFSNNIDNKYQHTINTQNNFTIVNVNNIIVKNDSQ